jgi:hypothetical protein
MEPQEFQALIRQCPLLIRTNDGHQFFVEKPEFIVVGDYSAALLVTDNGVRRINHVALMNVTSVVPQATASKQ